MGMEPPLPLTPREPACPLVPVSKDPVELIGDAPSPPPDPYHAPRSLEYPFDPSVAGQAANGIGGKANSVLRLAEPGAAV
jgi:hypothetical protein